MADIIKIEDVKSMIVPLRGVDVIPDFLVAHLYGVQTKEVNQAVKNNPDKFPEGFIMEYSREEKSELVKKFDRFNIKHSSATIKGFTEKGLYMLAIPFFHSRFPPIKKPCFVKSVPPIVMVFPDFEKDCVQVFSIPSRE